METILSADIVIRDAHLIKFIQDKYLFGCKFQLIKAAAELSEATSGVFSASTRTISALFPSLAATVIATHRLEVENDNNNGVPGFFQAL